MDQLSPEAAQNIAKLSCLELTSEELAQLTSELNQVLGVFAALDKMRIDADDQHDARTGLDFNDVAAHGVQLSRMRPDDNHVEGEPPDAPGERSERLRVVFPRLWEQFLEVPRVLDK